MSIFSVEVVGLTMPYGKLLQEGAKGPEDIVSYTARVSNPSNQSNFETGERLLQYCVKHKHYSVFQMSNALLEIIGPRDITRQFTRHESMVVVEDEPGDFTLRPDGMDKRAGGVQEFSQRYSSEIEFCSREVRLQDHKNRQNSFEATSEALHENWNGSLGEVQRHIEEEYSYWIGEGVAKECARVILPEGLTMSRLYVNGTLRSWLHYLDVREEVGVTQKEHVQLANLIREALTPVFPIVLGRL